MAYRVTVEARTGPAGLEPEIATQVRDHIARGEPALTVVGVEQDLRRNTIALHCETEAFDASEALRRGIGAMARAMVACGLSAMHGFARLTAEP